MEKWPLHSRPTWRDTTTRERHRCLRISAASSFFFFFFFFSFLDTCQLRPILTNSGQIGLYRAKPPKHTDSGHTNAESADSRRNSKKKVQNAPFELNNKTLNYLSSQNAPFFNLLLSLTLCASSPLSALCSPSPLSHRRIQSLPKTHSHSPILCMTLGLKLTSPHQPLLTQVSN